MWKAARWVFCFVRREVRTLLVECNGKEAASVVIVVILRQEEWEGGKGERRK